MIRFSNEKELLDKLFEDLKSSDKDRIVFLAGHFPLVYNEKGAIEALDVWGVFSKYTLELACKLAKYSNGIGKEVKFIFFVDDHIYEPSSGLSAQKISTRRKALYQKRSSIDAKLPDLYRDIMSNFGFSEKDVIRQDQKKVNRKDCLYFSEKILRASNIKIDNLCAKEYVAFLDDESYFSKDNDYIVSFIPQRCRDNICNFALGIKRGELKGSHIFLETMAKSSGEKELYSIGRGVLYRRD